MLEELLYESTLNGKNAAELQPRIIKLTLANKMKLAKQVIHGMRNGCIAQELDVYSAILQTLIESDDQELMKYVTNTVINISLPSALIQKIIMKYDAKSISAFLLNHPGITEAEILYLCQNHLDIEKLKILALRSDLSELVINHLLHSRDPGIAVNLLCNKNISLKVSHYEIIIRYFQDHPQCIPAITMREDLTNQVVDRFVEFFSKANREKFLNHYIHRPTFSNQESLWQKLNYHLNQQDEENAFKKVDLLYSRNQLFSSVVLRFLYIGDLLSFMYCLAKLTDIPFASLKFAFNNGYDQDFFQEIYHKANMPANMMTAINKTMSIVVAKLLENEINAENYRTILSDELRRNRGNIKIHKAQYIIELIENGG